MKIELIDKEKEIVNLLVKDTNPTEVNMLRRMIINDVPTLAIEEVNFIKNSSALYDEMVAHRLGLVALTTDLKSYNLPTECKGIKKGETVCTKENCPHHTLLFKLKVKGPKTVYAEDLESKDKKIKPVYSKTPIVGLLKKQELELEATAVMGQGGDHAKFSSGLAFFRGHPQIKIKNVKNPDSIKAICPKKVYDVKGGKLKTVDDKKCILCNACVDASEGEIEVKGSDTDFILTLEPWGQLKPDEMLSAAVDMMDSKLDSFNKLLKKI